MNNHNDYPIYALGAVFGSNLYSDWFTRCGLSVRGFGDKEAYRMLEEFTVARPRPALLIAQTCGEEGTGLSVAMQCRAIEPNLKLIVASGHPPKTLAGLFKRYPVVPDVQLQLASGESFWVVIWHAANLLRAAGIPPLERYESSRVERLNAASALPMDSHVNAYTDFQRMDNWPEKSRIYRGKPDSD